MALSLKHDSSIEEAFTATRTTKARNSIITIPLSFKLVVVSEFLICGSVSWSNQIAKQYDQSTGKLASLDVPQSVYNDSLAAIHFYDLSCTVRGAAMVDESCNASSLRCIYNCVFIDPEEVTATDPAFKIPPFPHICNLLPDFLSDVFDDHVVGRYILFSIKAPVVDCRPSKPHWFLSLLKLIKPKNVAFSTLSWKCLLLCIDIRNESTVINSS